jgi:hypothetical protein
VAAVSKVPQHKLKNKLIRSVGTDITLRTGRPSSIPDKGKNIFFLIYTVQTGSETHPASYPVSLAVRRLRAAKFINSLHLVPSSRFKTILFERTQYG